MDALRLVRFIRVNDPLKSKRHPPRPGQEVVGIEAEDRRDSPHPVLGRRRELVALDLGEVGGRRSERAA